VSSGPLTQPWSDSRAAAWGDFDNDGDLDLYLARDGQSNRLFRNDYPASFVDVTYGPLGAWSSTQECAWADYDNDGDIDLLLVNRLWESNELLRNDGGAFVDATPGCVADISEEGMGGAWGDFDGDGDLDLFLSNSDLNTGANRLLRNDSPGPDLGGPNWLQVTVVGTASNRSSIGARIRLVSGAAIQIREVDGGSGHFSQDSLPVEFGLGLGGAVDTLEVRWPSGKSWTTSSWTINQMVTAYEPTLPPDPFMSSVPTVLTSPSGSWEYSVLVKDSGGIELADTIVQIEISPKADSLLCWCPSQGHPVVEENTNAQGIAKFHLAGGGCLETLNP